MKRWIIIVALLSAVPCMAQVFSSAGPVVNNAGQPVPATIIVCAVATPGTNPPLDCATRVATYTDATLSVPCTLPSLSSSFTAGPISGVGCTNPGTTDSRGNYSIYANPPSFPNIYYAEIYGYAITTYIMPFTTGGGGSGGGAAITFSETPGGAVNGVNLTFTLVGTPSPSTSLLLTRNGLLQTQATDYTLSGSTITFLSVSKPQTGDILRATYQTYAGTAVSFASPGPIGSVVPNTGAFTTFLAGTSPSIDASSWNVSSFQFGKTSATPNVNAFGITSQLLVSPSGSAITPYQKAAILGQCQHNDTTASVNPRDCVGIVGQGIIQSGNTNGRAWGGNGVAIIQATGDGNAIGYEADVQNNATADAAWTLPNYPTNGKYGFTYSCIGSQKCTAGFAMSNVGTATHYGVIIQDVDTAAVVIPNNMPISGINAADTALINMMFLDTSNNLRLGVGSSQTNLTSTGLAPDASAHKHKRFSGICTTGAVQFNQCTTTVTWTTTFPDANYTPVCIGYGATNIPILEIETRIAAGITLRLTTMTNAAATFSEVDCHADHD